MAGDNGERAPRRATLDNGLRVLLAPRVRASRVAVSVHYGVGFRSEPPGWEGFAHLFEHLMFRGSESLPDGRFYDHIHRLGAQANGTTHQDYTDYFQVVPSAAAERALFGEADRMRAPRFTEHGLTEQLAGIETEIEQAVTGRPYGGFPWPFLPGVLFRGFANAHDGYGDPERLRHTTLDGCAEFFDTHYTPENAILTVAGDISPDRALELVHRHFADIPARPAPAEPDLDEPEPTEDRWAACEDPAISAPAVALGYRLPDPRENLAGYLAHTVLADMVNERGLADHGVPAVNASCGFFGPLDARHPDALVVTAIVPPRTRPAEIVEAVERCWADWSRGDAIADTVARRVATLAGRHVRQHADLQTRCRALGRLETLFSAAELVDTLPDHLAALDPWAVAAAARALREAAKAVLVVEPGAARTRPATTHAAGATPHLPAAERDRANGRPRRGARESVTGPAGPRPVPSLGVQPAPTHGASSDTTLDNGLRVAAIADDRAPLVELRLRLPLGVAAWEWPSRVASLPHHIEARTAAATRAQAFGGEFTPAVDGHWLDITGYAPSERLADWLDVLADVVGSTGDATAVEDPPTQREQAAHRPQDRVADEVAGRHWLARSGRDHGGTGGEPIGLGELCRRVMDPRRGVLIAVGDLTAERFPERVTAALGSWHPHDTAPVPTPPRPEETEAFLAVPDGRATAAHLLLCVPEPAEGADEPARYLATAITGGYFRSRLAERSMRHGAAGYEVHTGRDLLIGLPRACVRARTRGPESAETALREIREELERLDTTPPDSVEVDRAREFCAAQLLSAFDSQERLADLLRRTVATGREPVWLTRLPEALRETAVAEVRTAVRELFARGDHTTVALGGIPTAWDGRSAR